ncbi:HD domain-containing phosphohydrolase [Salirhabdus salicampi]|uniref:HD domain-containing phosphohydrolase n=1 Tax=Salirhabdus salicampi TaxID=476102 RepID=UPI0020C36A6C|nr:HD domain-containing phosphohydrolase [Salirhabdus salicampi]MCP8615728.1 HD domain-containing protein [Salirhabdus salicampi]
MPLKLKSYIYSVILLGLVLLLYSGINFDFTYILPVLIFGVVAGFLEKYMVELPDGKFFSGTLAISMIAVVFLGVYEAVFVELIAFLIGLYFIKIDIIKSLYNVAQYIICIFVAGFIYTALPTSENMFTLTDIPYMMIAIATYILCNQVLLSVVLSTLHQKPYIHVMAELLQYAFLNYLVTIALTILLGTTYHFGNDILAFIVTIFVVLFFLSLRYAFNLFIKLRKTYLTSIETLTNMKEKQLSLQPGHSTRVGRIARQFAEELNLSQDEIDQIHYAALFHDIGKQHIKQEIFIKKGPLTIEEENEYRKHVDFGAEIVQKISGMDNAAIHIMQHHEQWDGKGYPKGLKGTEISLGARIIALANLYDRYMYDDKVKNPKEEFKKLKGKELDPNLVDKALELLEFSRGSVLLPSENEFKDTIIEEMVISKTREKLYQSSLLNNFGAKLIATYDGTFRDEDGKEISIPAQNSILKLVTNAIKTKRRIRDFVEGSGNIYDVYCVPTGQSCHIILFDVTYVLEYENKQEKRVHSLYREVIYSVTSGKLLLLQEHELETINNENVIMEQIIEDTKDIVTCRQQLDVLLDDYNLDKKRKFQLLLCTSEAATNVLKHAMSGKMEVSIVDNKIRIMVKDEGSGINIADLPKSTLLSGYSSKVSLGHGFTLILKYMDQVMLHTNSKGTTLIMDVHLDEPASIEQIGQ